MKKINTVCAALLILLTLTGCGKTKLDTHDGYVFYSGEIAVEVGEDADEVISRLGKPNRSATAESCAGLGCDEVYYYNGFKIGAFREGDDCEITSIELTNDTVATREGIKIGSPESSVKKAYGEGMTFPGGIEYSSGDCTLRFYLSIGRVSAIKYLKSGD